MSGTQLYCTLVPRNIAKVSGPAIQYYNIIFAIMHTNRPRKWASCQFLSVDLVGDHNNSRHLITREFGMAAPFREVVAPSASFPLWRTGWTGGSKPGPKSSRPVDQVLCASCDLCVSISSRNSGNWASGKLRTVGEPSKYCTRLEKMVHRMGQAFMAMCNFS